jgi:hypothetical protein
VVLIAPVDCEPLAARAPDQPPEAAQDVALVDVQVRVELLPLTTLVGLALSETLGVGADTETVTDCAALPPAPVQVNVKLAAAVRFEVVCEPLVGSGPLQLPVATQEVALLEDHVKVDALPLLTVVGLALSVTDGAGVVTVTVAD